MDKPANVDAYIAAQPDHWQPVLQRVRDLMHAAGLRETIKWQFPVFMWKKKNVASLNVTKQYFGVWFFHGALLHDPDGLLHNAQEGKTIAMRHLRFTSPENVDYALAEQFIRAATHNQQQGLEVVIERSPRPEFDLPPLLQSLFEQRPELASAYDSFPPHKKREFCAYISDAKRETTKQNRLVKVTDHLLAGKGLSDKYRP